MRAPLPAECCEEFVGERTGFISISSHPQTQREGQRIINTINTEDGNVFILHLSLRGLILSRDPLQTGAPPLLSTESLGQARPFHGSAAVPSPRITNCGAHRRKREWDLDPQVAPG